MQPVFRLVALMMVFGGKFSAIMTVACLGGNYCATSYGMVDCAICFDVIRIGNPVSALPFANFRSLESVGFALPFVDHLLVS